MPVWVLCRLLLRKENLRSSLDKHTWCLPLLPPTHLCACTPPFSPRKPVAYKANLLSCSASSKQLLPLPLPSHPMIDILLPYTTWVVVLPILPFYVRTDGLSCTLPFYLPCCDVWTDGRTGRCCSLLLPERKPSPKPALSSLSLYICASLVSSHCTQCGRQHASSPTLPGKQACHFQPCLNALITSLSFSLIPRKGKSSLFSSSMPLGLFCHLGGVGLLMDSEMDRDWTMCVL